MKQHQNLIATPVTDFLLSINCKYDMTEENSHARQFHYFRSRNLRFSIIVASVSSNKTKKNFYVTDALAGEESYGEVQPMKSEQSFAGTVSTVEDVKMVMHLLGMNEQTMDVFKEM